MEWIQLVIIVFALFAFSRVVLQFKDRAKTLGEFAFWCLIWVGVIVVTALPSTVVVMSNVLGGGRAMDLIAYSSIIVLFYLIFRLYVKTEKTEKSITELARELAIKRAK